MNYTILNVADTEAVRYTRTCTVRAGGFTVLEAATGAEAVRMASEHHPNVMLVDVHLSDFSGLEVCRQIKTDPKTASIQVLHIVSTAVTEPFQAIAFESGADGYLVEPVDPRVLIGTIGASIRQWQKQDELRVTLNDLKATKDALEQSRERLDVAFRSGGIGTFDWYVTSGDVVWDEQEERLFGVEPGRFEGCVEGWSKRVHPDDLHRTVEHLENVMSRGVQDVDFEFRIVRHGEIRWIAGSGRFYYDDDGKPTRMIGFNQDITERKRTERELRHRTDELTRSNDDLQHFAYAAAHDLQEPLRIITAYSELLTRKGVKGNPDTEQSIAFILQGVDRMRTLIHDLLGYFEVAQTQPKPERPVSLETVVAEAIWNLQTAIGESGAQVNYGELPSLPVHERQMVQVFQNLIGNAIKYRSAERTPEVKISGRFRCGDWMFCVEDNGIGLDMAYADQIFDVFKRLHNREEYPGSGIGLALCKRIVGRHGGRIWVESEPGKGSKFCFTLSADTKPERAVGALQG